MTKKQLLVGYRLLFGLLGFSALVTEIATLVERGKLIPANFFSYFTIESNSFAVFVLLLSAFALYGTSKRKIVPLLRGASTLYMAIVGIVFPLLLSGLENVAFTAVPWDNIVLHYLMPVVVVLDWFLDLPRIRITFKKALTWLIFPVAYVVYSLVRGPIANWYPYPFLNPDLHGYAPVVLTSLGLMAGAVALIWGLTKLTGRGAKRVANS